MRKFIVSAVAFTLLPALLLGHYLTQHTAFLFVIGFLHFIIIPIIVLGVIGIMHSDDNDFSEQLAKYNKLKFINFTFQAIATLYLLYASAFITVTIYLVSVICSYVLIFTMKSISTKNE
jgi:hypothetical protein